MPCVAVVCVNKCSQDGDRRPTADWHRNGTTAWHGHKHTQDWGLAGGEPTADHKQLTRLGALECRLLSIAACPVEWVLLSTAGGTWCKQGRHWQGTPSIGCAACQQRLWVPAPKGVCVTVHICVLEHPCCACCPAVFAVFPRRDSRPRPVRAWLRGTAVWTT